MYHDKTPRGKQKYWELTKEERIRAAKKAEVAFLENPNYIYACIYISKLKKIGEYAKALEVGMNALQRFNGHPSIIKAIESVQRFKDYSEGKNTTPIGQKGYNSNQVKSAFVGPILPTGKFEQERLNAYNGIRRPEAIEKLTIYLNENPNSLEANFVLAELFCLENRKSEATGVCKRMVGNLQISTTDQKLFKRLRDITLSKKAKVPGVMNEEIQPIYNRVKAR